MKVPCLERELTIKVVLEFTSFISDKLEEWKKVTYLPYLGFLPLSEMLSYRDYIRIEERRLELWRALRKVFEKYDFLITPTTAVKPFEIGKISPEEID